MEAGGEAGTFAPSSGRVGGELGSGSGSSGSGSGSSSDSAALSEQRGTLGSDEEQPSVSHSASAEREREEEREKASEGESAGAGESEGVGERELDWFSVDLNEELTAMDSASVERQAAFVALAVRQVRRGAHSERRAGGQGE